MFCPQKEKYNSTGMLRRVALVRTNVSEELRASIIRMTTNALYFFVAYIAW
jgi:hypothetical protein